MADLESTGPAPIDWTALGKRVLRSPLTAIATIAGGILCGLYFPHFSHEIGPIAQVYLNFLKMVVLPFLVSSVIFSITSMVQYPQSFRYLGRVGIAVVIVLFVSVLISGTLSVIIQPGRIDDPQTRIELGQFINSQGSVSADLEFPLKAPPTDASGGKSQSIFVDLVPNNVFSALASGHTIQVLLFCLLFGLAVGRIPQPSALSLKEALNAVYKACIMLTNWFVWALPFATFILMAEQTALMGTKPLIMMSGFLIVMTLSSFICVAICLIIISIRSRLSYWATIKTCQPMIMVALTTRSTVASLPWAINLLAERLKFNLVVVELLVPLQAVLLRVGPVLLYTIGTLFIAQMYDRQLAITDLALVGVVCALLSLTTSGMTGLVILSQMSIACGYLKLPFEAAFVLFVAVEAVTDALMTIASVTTVAASTAVIAPHSEGANDASSALSELSHPASPA